MIAWVRTPPGTELIANGRWQVFHVVDRTELLDIPRHELQAPPPVRKGFRTPPLNPGKRIKSLKPKRRR